MALARVVTTARRIVPVATTNVTDREQLDRWMTAAADGDRDAIEPLFHALRPVVTCFAARFLGDQILAEDCAQEALVRLFGQLDRYDPSRDALTWALAIVTWECRSARRRLSRRNETSDLPETSFDGVALAEDRELLRAALATLGSLAARDLEIITAALDDDDDLRERLAPATFRKRLERALARLRLSWRSRHV
jgi:RNA polymerase sigma factor (sigma-70 family)